MTISERTLRKWRKEALHETTYRKVPFEGSVEEPRSELCRKILHMTQELLDQHLLKK